MPDDRGLSTRMNGQAGGAAGGRTRAGPYQEEAARRDTSACSPGRHQGTARPHRPVRRQGGQPPWGHGKAWVRSETEWLEVADLLFATNDCAVVEPYINYRRDGRGLYRRDGRCLYRRDGRGLAILGRYRAMARAGGGWKAHQRRHGRCREASRGLR